MSAAHKKATWVLPMQAAREATQRRDSRLDPQRLARLRARAATANVQFHCFNDEDTGQTIFAVSRWAMVRQLESVEAAEKWLDMVLGVKNG